MTDFIEGLLVDVDPLIVNLSGVFTMFDTCGFSTRNFFVKLCMRIQPRLPLTAKYFFKAGYTYPTASTGDRKVPVLYQERLSQTVLTAFLFKSTYHI